MTKKRLLLFALIPLAIAVILGLFFALPDHAGPNKANFDRVAIGMTVPEVEDLFSFGPGSIQNPPGDEIDLVTSAGQVITLRFKDGRVTDKQWHDPHENVVNKIRRWLDLD